MDLHDKNKCQLWNSREDSIKSKDKKSRKRK